MNLLQFLAALALLLTLVQGAAGQHECIYKEQNYKNLGIIKDGCSLRQCQYGQSVLFHKACDHAGGSMCILLGLVFTYNEITYECKEVPAGKGFNYVLEAVNLKTDNCLANGTTYATLDISKIGNGCTDYQCQGGNLVSLGANCRSDVGGGCYELNFIWQEKGITYKCIQNEDGAYRGIKIDDKPEITTQSNTRYCNHCPALKADIIFAVDGFQNVSKDHFKFMLQFLSFSLTGFKIGADNVRVGAVVSSSPSAKEFDLKTYRDYKSVSKAIQDIQFREDKTDTEKLLKFVVDADMYGTAAGGRDDAPNILIVITSGSSANNDQTVAAAKRVQSEPAQVVTVGVGKVNEEVLHGIASSPENVFLIPSYFEIYELIFKLTDQICKEILKSSETTVANTGVTTVANTEATVANTGETTVANTGETTVANTGVATMEANSGETTVANTGVETMEANSGETTVANTGVATMEANSGENTLAYTGETKVAKTGETTVANTSEATVANTGETTLANTGEATVANSGETTVANTGETIQANSGETKVAKTGERTVANTSAPGCPDVGADIIFLLDSSSGVGFENYEQKLKLAVQITNKFTVSPEKVQVGAVLINTEAERLFKLNTNLNQGAVSKALLAAPYRGGTREVEKALDLVLSEELFHSNSGGRKNVAPVLIVIIDGPFENVKNTAAVASRLQDKDIEIISIGIDNYVYEDLMDISGDSKNVFRSCSYSTFLHEINGLLNRLCQVIKEYNQGMPESPHK